jgi:hypothetical protein
VRLSGASPKAVKKPTIVKLAKWGFTSTSLKVASGGSVELQEPPDTKMKVWHYAGKIAAALR